MIHPIERGLSATLALATAFALTPILVQLQRHIRADEILEAEFVGKLVPHKDILEVAQKVLERLGVL